MCVYEVATTILSFLLLASDTNLHENLADLTCEISIKEKLIEELELNHKRLHSMRSQYESKLVVLQQRIHVTEKERDKVISNVCK